MNRLLRTAALALVLLAASACIRHKIIPDDELALIFRDAFLTNAYVSTQGLKSDSLKPYEPIFARYGYTTEDVHYTIGNFSKRKSARLGDVVEQAIDLLEEEGKIYDREVMILDTIDNVARRTFTRRILGDSLIRVERLRDTARMSFVLDVQPGEYQIKMGYRIDSLDRNERGIRTLMWLERADSSRANPFTTTLRRHRDETLTRRFTADSTHRRLRIHLMTFIEEARRPSMRVTDLRIDYTPPTEVAVDSLYHKQLDIRILADEFIRTISRAAQGIAADSLQ